MAVLASLRVVEIALKIFTAEAQRSQRERKASMMEK
jgi:hypothetical protein